MESEAIGKNIAKALFQVQTSLPAVKRDARNDHFKSRYATLTGVLEALLPACMEAGVVVIQHPVPSEPNVLALETLAIHAETGESLGRIITMPLAKPDPQGYGSAITYARRYGLMAFFAMQADDDDAEQAMHRPQGQGQSRPQPQPYPQRPQGQGYTPRNAPANPGNPPSGGSSVRRPMAPQRPVPVEEDDPFSDMREETAPKPDTRAIGRL